MLTVKKAVKYMAVLTPKEWGARLKPPISVSRVNVLLNQKRVPGAKRIGKQWLIPMDSIYVRKPHGWQKGKPRPMTKAKEKAIEMARKKAEEEVRYLPIFGGAIKIPLPKIKKKRLINKQ